MAGLGTHTSLLSTVGIGIVNFTFTLLAIGFIDKIGRKTLMLIGSVGLIVSLGLVSRTFYTNDFSGYAITVYLMVYIAFFAFSQGAVIWVFISEIFPQYCIDKKLVRKEPCIFIDDSCTHCERCMNICPMRVFHKVEGNVVPRDEESCIHCSLCQRECPTNSISVHHGFIDALRIAARHAKRKSL